MRKCKKLAGFVLMLLMFMSIISYSYAETELKIAETKELEFAEDTIIVMFNSDESLRLESKSVNDFDEVPVKAVRNLSEGTTERVEKRIAKISEEAKVSASLSLVELEDSRENKDEVIENYRLIVCLELEDPGKENVLKAVKKLSSRSDIECAEPDYYYYTCATTPNDTYITNQWGLDKVKAKNAWDICTGSSIIRVGVMDTGIDGTHPDLVNRVNSSLSRSFLNGIVTLDNPSTDTIGHGTHVAGIIGAQTNNLRGIAGICWNVELISLKVCAEHDETGGRYGGNASWFIAAIDYAEQNNIDVINFSVSGKEESSAFYTKIANYSGLFICAAGQEEGRENNLDSGYLSNKRYPASWDLDNIIVVGAITQSTSTKLSPVLYSNIGAVSVDLYAPGANIYSTLPNNSYGYQTGTSMATPFVTGAVVLLKAEYPNLSNGEIKRTLMDTSEKYFSDQGNNPLEGKAASEAFLNIYNALRYISHTGGSYTYTNMSIHSAICKECGMSYQEAHTWKKVNNIYRCTKCLMQTTTIPDIQ